MRLLFAMIGLCTLAIGCGDSPFWNQGTGGTNGGAGLVEGDPRFVADCSGGPLAAPIANCKPEALPSSGDRYADCVTRINQLRWECQCLPALQRWTEAEGCADQHSQYDSTRSAHSGFRSEIRPWHRQPPVCGAGCAGATHLLKWVVPGALHPERPTWSLA